MSMSEVVKGLGGLALFLYGMQMMSGGMEAAAGNKLKGVLEKLTANRFLGVAAGAVITAIIQSSSATTVMVVGFVNSGMLSLSQAVWVIMGANIGTTITGQLIAMDVGVIAPVIAFVGVVLVVFVKRPKTSSIGSILAGLGVLFIGMEMMSNAMMPLRDSKMFVELMTQFSNPLLGICAGALFTAVIQSSSASVGILQALAVSGAISFPSAVYVLFGQNIGTCITALLASIGTNRNAKRSTLLHFSFNIIGTILFTILSLVTPIVSMVGGMTPSNPAAQIANMHTLFNLVTTLVLLPYGNLLVRMMEKVLPDREEDETVTKLLYIKDLKTMEQAKLGVSAITIEQVNNEIERMLGMARENVMNSFLAYEERNPERMKDVEEREEYIDYLNKEISKYISKVLMHEQSKEGCRIFSAYFNITGNVERISDHAMNICGYSKWLKEKEIVFSKEAKEEIASMRELSDNLLQQLLSCFQTATPALGSIAAMEQKIDDMTEAFRDGMLTRIKQGDYQEEGAILYSEMLTDFERIGDHALNISEELTKVVITEQKEKLWNL